MGLDKLTALWNRAKDSLWFVPTFMTLGAGALAFGAIQLDMAGLLPRSEVGLWIFSGSASGARGVLTAIASGLITVTGVVFSVTIVALQLASTQFTPRILRNFMADRGNQVVLGAFIGTFTYALLVLRVVRGGADPAGADAAAAGATGAGAAGSTAFVPNIAVTGAVVLTVVSIGLLIYFIDHSARSVQASTIIHRVMHDGMRALSRLVPETVGIAGDDDVAAVLPAAPGRLVDSERSGYVQGLNHEALLDLLEGGNRTVRIERQVGDFVLPGTVLATVWPSGSDSDDTAGAIRDAFVLGRQRTPHMDLELAFIELVDIAVKALSPGINDPTTATLCVDRIIELLLAFGRRDPPGRVRRADHGRSALILPRLELVSLMDLAFDQIRHFGAGNPRFARTLLERLEQLGALLPPEHRRTVARHVAATLRSSRAQVEEPSDRAVLRRVGRRVLSTLAPS